MSGPLRLYELVLENGRSASPYVWRIRYALAQKQVAYESVMLGFTDIPRTFSGRCKTVPVIEHDGTLISDSWDIAEYLDRTFHTGVKLFSTPAELAMCKLMDAWFAPNVARRMLHVYVLDVHDAAKPEDRAYFRQSREARLQSSLEAVVENRIATLAELREALAPLRTHLRRFPFLGGAAPNYTDYIALGALLWVGSVSTLPLLARDDEVMCAWLERGLELYGGIGRDPRLKPLIE
jgi:glutathione S-transferase